MSEPNKKRLRAIDAPFVALGPSGVAIRDRLKRLTPQDDTVLRMVGEHLGSLASRGIPTGRLKARLVSMAAEQDLSIVAVDPAYTSMWGDEHWRKPLTSNKRKMSRHDSAAVAIGRRALGHPIRRRTAPPRDDQSDRYGHRTVQAGPEARGREETRPSVTERAHHARRRTGTNQRTRGTSASKTVRDARSAGQWVQNSLLLTD